MINGQIIILDYPVNPQPRYGFGKPPHPELTQILNRYREQYKIILNGFLRFRDYFKKINKYQMDISTSEPAWINGWLPGLDSASIYSFLAMNNPKRYFEIGSGNSTKFARRAIKDHNLQTSITSFDPHPRAEIDTLCDRVIRQPVEEVDLDIFNELDDGDILFVDHSHRSFMNSDATVVFMEILPRLKSGVLVEFHDILLPYDYPPEWQERFYNEQYLLAAYLLAMGNRFEVILPNFFISKDNELSKVIAPLWEDLEGVETHGGSFWIRIN